MDMQPAPTNNPKPQLASIGTLILVSFLVGGISGGAIGAITANGGLAKLLNRSTAVSETTKNVKTETLNLKEESATVEVVKQVSPAVVSIIAKKDFSKVFGNEDQQSPFYDLFGFPFFQPTQPQGNGQVGSGSGFIISSDGMILTNKHVATIPGADLFTVIMNDQKTYDAKVIATDPATDIALMKIDVKDLPTIELGNSDSVQAGDTVIAIGNVLGQYRNSVTKGIISGLARTIKAGDGAGNVETLSNVIQTDAAINSGNSGGPLLNLAGQAIGINTAIDREGQLIGFAIPINVAKRDVESLKKTGKIERPYLGIRYSIINQQVKEANNLTVDYGALVVRGNTVNDLAVIPGSPADKAGIVENDIILEMDGQKITEDYDLAQALQDKEIGQSVTLKIQSKGQDKTIQVKLEARPS